jgi:diguanylate cyclase
MNAKLREMLEEKCEAELVIGSLRHLGVPATPDNYALWYEYHAGVNPGLQRTIDALVSNHALFDDKVLEDLHSNFFSLAREKKAIRETSSQVLETLKELISVATGAHEDVNRFGATLRDLASSALSARMQSLRELIENLVQESQRMAGRSECSCIRMRESADRIENLERDLESALREAALDGLTGIANRRSFEQMLRRLAGETMNSGKDLSLLMVDIDHFKRVNDTWGHQTGDRVICHVAACLRQSVRGEDVVARYGGEEFAVLLPHTDLSSAATVGENIRALLTREPLRLEVTPPMAAITVSIGASAYDPGEPLAEWVARADEALYHAKVEGRNCVKSA